MLSSTDSYFNRDELRIAARRRKLARQAGNQFLADCISQEIDQALEIARRGGRVAHADVQILIAQAEENLVR